MTDAVYYAQREQAQRALAESAADPKVREIHLKLATKYAELAARELAGPTPLPSRRNYAAWEGH
jgi:hypothetical protein